MSDLVKTISSWQVCANSYTHTHTLELTQTERETLEELLAELVQLGSQFQFQLQ